MAQYPYAIAGNYSSLGLASYAGRVTPSLHTIPRLRRALIVAQADTAVDHDSLVLGWVAAGHPDPTTGGYGSVEVADFAGMSVSGGLACGLQIRTAACLEVLTSGEVVDIGHDLEEGLPQSEYRPSGGRAVERFSSKIYDAEPELCCYSGADCLDDHERLDWPGSDDEPSKEAMVSRMTELIPDLVDDDDTDLPSDEGDSEADARDEEFQDVVDGPGD